MLDAILDGFQAEVGVREMRRPFPGLRSRKLQDGQRFAQRLQLVCPAVNTTDSCQDPSLLGNAALRTSLQCR